MLRVGDKPLRLLRHVRGHDLVELPAADQCCGFGGTFALKNADTSTAMLADKMRHVLATGAEALTAGDASCLMHIGGGLSRLRSGTRTVHLAEILAATERRRTPPRGGAVSTVPRDAGGRARAGSGTCAATQPFPARPRRRAGRHPAAPQPRPRHHRDPRQARRASSPSSTTGRSCAGAGEAIKTATMARLDEHLERLEARGHRPRRRGALGPRRQRGQRDRHRARAGHRRRPRSSRSSRWPPRRSGSTRRWRPRGSRP